MATQKKDQLAVITAKIERRVNLSEAMLKAMGVEPELFLRVALNALVMNPTIGDCTPDSVDKAILNNQRQAHAGRKGIGHSAVQQ